MKTKNNRKIQTILNLLLLLTLLAAMSGCDDSDNKQTVNSPVPNDTLTEEKTPKETATPTPDNSAEQSDTEQKTDESTNNAVTFNSFGKVKVGMTVSQASQALGTELVGSAEDGMNCYYVNPKQGFKGVRFMVTNKTIARIDIESKAYATDKGAKIGDTEARIKSLYKGVNVSPNKYDEKKHDLEVYSNDKKYLIIFETDGNLVTGFRVGKAEEVGYVEGCS